MTKEYKGSSGDYAKNFFRNETKNSGGDSGCSFLIFYENRLVGEFSDEPCHGQLQNDVFENPKAIYSTLWWNDKCHLITRDDCLPYWEYIFDKKKSPWRAILKRSKVFRRKKGTWYFRLSDMDVPGQLLASFLIATRFPVESPEGIKLFNALRTNDFSLSESLYLSSQLDLKKEGYVTNKESFNDHITFEKNGTSFRRINEADPYVNWDCSTFKNGGVLIPINVIWEGKNLDLGQLLKAHEKYRGKFPDQFKRQFQGGLNFRGNSELVLEKAIKRLKETKGVWRV